MTLDSTLRESASTSILESFCVGLKGPVTSPMMKLKILVMRWPPTPSMQLNTSATCCSNTVESTTRGCMTRVNKGLTSVSQRVALPELSTRGMWTSAKVRINANPASLARSFMTSCTAPMSPSIISRPSWKNRLTAVVVNSGEFQPRSPRFRYLFH